MVLKLPHLLFFFLIINNKDDGYLKRTVIKCRFIFNDDSYNKLSLEYTFNDGYWNNRH